MYLCAGSVQFLCPEVLFVRGTALKNCSSIHVHVVGTRNHFHVCSCSKLMCHRDPQLARAFALLPLAGPLLSSAQFLRDSTPLQLKYEKRFRALEGFLPIFLFKNGGGKGSTDICSCASCSQEGPGFSCRLHAGFQLDFTSRRHLCLHRALSSCTLPFQ